MSRLTLAVVLFALAAASAASPLAADTIDDLLFDLQLVPLAGRTPPPLSLESLGGDTVTLAGLRGRPVLLYFWASW